MYNQRKRKQNVVNEQITLLFCNELFAMSTLFAFLCFSSLFQHNVSIISDLNENLIEK